MNLEAHAEATRSLSTLLAKGDGYHTEAFYDSLGRRLVAHALLVRGYLEPVVETDRVLLQRQRPASYSDVDVLEEECHLLERELREKTAMLVDARRRAVPDYDPDARGADEDDARIGRERADEKAAAGMPRVAS